MKRILVLLFIGIIGLQRVDAQELNINVKVSAPQLKLADPKIFQSLESSINELYNNTRWTEDEFEPEERIEGNLLINIKEELSSNSFVADFRMQTIRPVYNSTYNTQVLNHIDKDVSFEYNETQILQKSVNGFIDNLSQILTFYAYIMIGYDYETFAMNGGQEYFKMAENIINNVPPNVSNSDRGWTSQGNRRNRFKLIADLMDPRAIEYRKAFYEYHREGLDNMTIDLGKSQVIMIDCVRRIGEVENVIRNSMVVNLFSDSKRNELIDVFSGADKKQSREVYKTMVKIDPAQADRYSILKN